MLGFPKYPKAGAIASAPGAGNFKKSYQKGCI